MHSDRLLGVCFVLFGVLLLFVLIPEHVSEGRGYTDPGRFPRVAAYLFIGLGAMHAATSVPTIAWPTPRTGVRMALIVALVVAACVLMPRIGYLAAAIVFMAALTVAVFERRAVWIAVTTLAVPVSLYAFFVLLLDRPLPRASMF